VGQLLGGAASFEVTLLHVVPEPEEDYFPTSAQKEEWLTRHRKKSMAYCKSIGDF